VQKKAEWFGANCSDSMPVCIITSSAEKRWRMEELVIRFGSWEGPRNPTEDDIRKALEDIESGACARPEFTIERVSNWKPEVRDGRRVIRCVMEGRFATAATFYGEGSSIPLGWFIRYFAEENHSFALATAENNGNGFVEGICCGGPLTIRFSCLAPLKTALDALTYFAQHQDRSPNHTWLVESECYRFE
jgi:hypothetical protein